MASTGLNRWRGAAIFYLVAVSQSVGGTRAEATPANDAFENRTVLAGLTNFVLASNEGATTEPGEPLHGDSSGGRSVWWTWTAPATGTFRVSTEGSNFDTLLGVYFGSRVSNLGAIANDDDSGENSTSIVIFRAIAGQSYEIAVDGFQRASGTIAMSVGPSGQAAPSWTLRTALGALISSGEFRNKVVLLDFFETYCQACIEETPDLKYLRQQIAAEGFEIVAVAKDSLTAHEVDYNVQQLGITYPVVLTSSGVETTYGGPFTFIPTKFLIDREGKIQRTLVGPYTHSEYYKMITPLLAGARNLKVEIRTQPGAAVLSWPATEFGWSVEGTSGLTNRWDKISIATVQTNNENTVTVPFNGGTTFYRLRRW